MNWWTIVVELLVVAMLASVCVILLPWLKERLSAEQLSVLQRWVAIAVQAAEQLFGAGTGSQKKAYVLEWLTKQGIKLDADALDAMIEAAVRQLCD